MTGIHFNNPLNNDPLQGARPHGITPGRQPPAEPRKSGEGEAVAPTSWADKLESLPEIRPEVVARGKELLADPNYPDSATISRAAEILLDGSHS